MRSKKKVIGALLLGTALLVIYYLYNPVTSFWAPKCPFKVVTGLQCPGCGLQRALHALLQGKVLEAIHYNYFLLFGAPYLSLFGVRALLPAGNFKRKLASVIEDRILILLYVVLFFVWLVVRNILHI